MFRASEEPVCLIQRSLLSVAEHTTLVESPDRRERVLFPHGFVAAPYDQLKTLNHELDVSQPPPAQLEVPFSIRRV